MADGYTLHNGTALAEAVAPTIVALLAVVLRLIARRRKTTDLGADDFFAVAALLFQVGMMTLMIWLTKNGAYQYPFDELPDSLRRANLIVVYAGSFLTTGIEAASKLSLLCLYLRIFGSKQSVRYPVWVLIGVTLIWYCVCMAGSVARCSPIPAFWEPEGTYPDAVCINTSISFAATEAVHCATELVMVAIAANVVCRLQMPARKKLALSGIFALGILNIIVSVVRITKTYTRDAINQSFLDNGAWVAVQSVTAIWVACLPTFGALLPQQPSVRRRIRVPSFASIDDDDCKNDKDKGGGKIEDRDEHSDEEDKDSEHIIRVGCLMDPKQDEETAAVASNGGGLHRSYGSADCIHELAGS